MLRADRFVTQLSFELKRRQSDDLNVCPHDIQMLNRALVPIKGHSSFSSEQEILHVCAIRLAKCPQSPLNYRHKCLTG